MKLTDINLRYLTRTLNGRKRNTAERGTIIGASQSGKSELATQLIKDYQARYDARVLIIDTKPRYRAEWTPQGVSTKGKYKNWSYGEPYEGSMLVDLDIPASLDDVWGLGSRTAIAQVDGDMSTRQLGQMLMIIKRFYDKSRPTQPRLLYIDELGDFYGANGGLRSGLWGVGDQILRCVRAGAERGIAVLCSTQRPSCIATQIIQESRILYLFTLDNTNDVKTLQQRGLSTSVMPPTDADPEFSFRTFDKRTRPASTRLCRLSLK